MASKKTTLGGKASGELNPSTGSSKPLPPRPLPLKSLNHVSIHCRDVEQSLRFYRDLMGFIPVKRPTCLDYFDGAWLFNYGLGIHLLKVEEDDEETQDDATPVKINPRSDHVSFQCDDISVVEAVLAEHGIPFVRQTVEENGVMVEQLFFHDPDCHMIEICNCDVLPVVPLQGSPSCFTAASKCGVPVASLGAAPPASPLTLSFPPSAHATGDAARDEACEANQDIVRVALEEGVEEGRGTFLEGSAVESAVTLAKGAPTPRSGVDGPTINLVTSSEGVGLDQLKRKVQNLRISGCGGSCNALPSPKGACTTISSLAPPGGHVASITPARRFSSPDVAHAALCQLCMQSMQGFAAQPRSLYIAGSTGLGHASTHSSTSQHTDLSSHVTANGSPLLANQSEASDRDRFMMQQRPMQVPAGA